MIRFASDFWSSKTTWLAFGYVLFNIGDGIIHSRSLSEVVTHIFAALAALFVRDTVMKGFELPFVFQEEEKAGE